MAKIARQSDNRGERIILYLLDHRSLQAKKGILVVDDGAAAKYNSAALLITFFQGWSKISKNFVVVVDSA